MTSALIFTLAFWSYILAMDLPTVLYIWHISQTIHFCRLNCLMAIIHDVYMDCLKFLKFLKLMLNYMKMWATKLKSTQALHAQTAHCCTYPQGLMSHHHFAMHHLKMDTSFSAHQSVWATRSGQCLRNYTWKKHGTSLEYSMHLCSNIPRQLGMYRANWLWADT